MVVTNPSGCWCQAATRYEIRQSAAFPRMIATLPERTPRQDSLGPYYSCCRALLHYHPTRLPPQHNCHFAHCANSLSNSHEMIPNFPLQPRPNILQRWSRELHCCLRLIVTSMHVNAFADAKRNRTPTTSYKIERHAPRTIVAHARYCSLIG
jgi:hypothetical protein